MEQLYEVLFSTSFGATSTPGGNIIGFRVFLSISFSQPNWNNKNWNRETSSWRIPLYTLISYIKPNNNLSLEGVHQHSYTYHIIV